MVEEKSWQWAGGTSWSGAVGLSQVQAWQDFFWQRAQQRRQQTEVGLAEQDWRSDDGQKDCWTAASEEDDETASGGTGDEWELAISEPHVPEAVRAACTVGGTWRWKERQWKEAGRQEG